MYIDEAHDYSEDSHVLFNLFEQSRKYGLGIVWAHQYLGQLPQQLAQSISANTAIKFAGGVSASDARTFAGQMRTTQEFIEEQKRGTFAAYFKDIGTVSFPVNLGGLDRTPAITNISAIREEMRKKYGAPPVVVQQPNPPTPPKPTEPAKKSFKVEE
jgi:hypothetical protein